MDSRGILENFSTTIFFVYGRLFYLRFVKLSRPIHCMSCIENQLKSVQIQVEFRVTRSWDLNALQNNRIWLFHVVLLKIWSGRSTKKCPKSYLSNRPQVSTEMEFEAEFASRQNTNHGSTKLAWYSAEAYQKGTIRYNYSILFHSAVN